MRALLCLIAMAVAGADAFAQYTSILETGSKHYIVDNNVNLRSGPGKEFAVVGKLSAGAEVVVVEASDIWLDIDGVESPWYKVIADGQTGYVCGRYVSHKELAISLDGKTEIFACVNFCAKKNTPLDEYLVSFGNYDAEAVLICDGSVRAVYLSARPEKELNATTVYKWLRKKDGAIYLTAVRGFWDGDSGWSKTRYYRYAPHKLTFVKEIDTPFESGE